MLNIKQLQKLGQVQNLSKSLNNTFGIFDSLDNAEEKKKIIDNLKDSLSQYSKETITTAAIQAKLSEAQAQVMFTAKGLEGTELDNAMASYKNATAKKAETNATLGLKDGKVAASRDTRFIKREYNKRYEVLPNWQHLIQSSHPDLTDQFIDPFVAIVTTVI